MSSWVVWELNSLSRGDFHSSADVWSQHELLWMFVKTFWLRKTFFFFSRTFHSWASDFFLFPSWRWPTERPLTENPRADNKFSCFIFHLFFLVFLIYWKRKSFSFKKKILKITLGQTFCVCKRIFMISQQIFHIFF